MIGHTQSMENPIPLEQALAGRFKRFPVDRDDMILEAFVIARVLPKDGGKPKLLLAQTEDMDDVVARGMMSLAFEFIENSCLCDDCLAEEDEDGSE